MIDPKDSTERKSGVLAIVAPIRTVDCCDAALFL